MSTVPARVACAGLVAMSLAACAGGSGAPARDEASEFQQDFGERDSDFASTGTNPYFKLEVGYVLEFEGPEGRRAHHLTITVLDETEVVAGVETRVVEERETVGGELEEVSRNYFAISRRTGSVYYFGEDVDIYRLGQVHSHEGSWRAGRNGARYGLFMPGSPAVGMRYFQEIAPGIAMDRAEVVALDRQLKTPAGTFDAVLEWEETSLLEPGAKEGKWFAKGIGLVRDDALSLVKYGEHGTR